ncbi:hypothetical protein Tco_0739673 [Tanacetum coccineum]
MLYCRRPSLTAAVTTVDGGFPVIDRGTVYNSTLVLYTFSSKSGVLQATQAYHVQMRHLRVVRVFPKKLPSTSQVLKNLNNAQDLLSKFDECIKRRTTLSPCQIGSWEQSDIKGAFKKDVIRFSENLKETFKLFEKEFIAAVKEMKDIFEQMEDEVDQCSVAKKCFKIEKKQLLINNDRLLEENIASDIMCTYLRSLNEVDNYGKCKSLDIVLLVQESNKSLSELRKHFAKLEEYSISLDIAFQNHIEKMINDSRTNNNNHLVQAINNQSFKINDLKSPVTQCESPNFDSRIQKIEDENVYLAFQLSSLVKEREHIKLEYKKLYDSIKQIRAKMKLQTDYLQQKLNDQIFENRTKLYSVTPLPKSKVIPKVVEKNDLSKSINSYLTNNKIIEKYIKVLAPGLLKIESKPINMYFKNNRDVHRDYLNVTKE